MISWPWDSLVIGKNEETGFPIYDRGYKAEELRAVLKMFFSDGVFYQEPSSFTVTPGEGMSVLVSPGRCFIQGDAAVEVSTREIVFAAASSQPRIDTVVLRWDNNIDARKIDLYVVQGVASATPVRPTLTRAETVWELGICDVFHPANATSVSADRITDTRLDDSRCGLSTPLMDVDTSDFFGQIQAAVDKAVELANQAIDETTLGNINLYIPSSAPNPGWVIHRNTFRGKNLGSEFTDEQKEHIRDGSFDDLYIGDFWESGNRKFLIADVNYYYKSGNVSSIVNDHHLIVALAIGPYEMNNTSSNAAGYAGSYIKNHTIPTNIQPVFEDMFGADCLMLHTNRFSNAVSSGNVTGIISKDTKIDIVNSNMILGSQLSRIINVQEMGYDMNQLAFFKILPRNSCLFRDPFWLRDPYGDHFAFITHEGWIGSMPANSSSVAALVTCPIIG